MEIPRSERSKFFVFSEPMVFTFHDHIQHYYIVECKLMVTHPGIKDILLFY